MSRRSVSELALHLSLLLALPPEAKRVIDDSTPIELRVLADLRVDRCESDGIKRDADLDSESAILPTFHG